MTYLALQITAATYCLFLGLFVTPSDNLKSMMMFRAIPLIIGVGMAFFLIARFMGWPV